MQCGVGPDFIDYDVQLRTDNGEMRVGVRLARMLLEDSQFVSWSAPELALLWFLQCGVPPELGLRTGTRWCDCANLHGAGPIARMLSELTRRNRSRVEVALAMHGLHECTRSAKSSARSHLLPGSMVRVLSCIDACDTGGAVDSTHTDDDAGGMPPERPVSELLMATARRHSFSPCCGACLIRICLSNGPMHPFPSFAPPFQTMGVSWLRVPF